MSATDYEGIIEDLKKLKLATMRHNLDAHLRLAQSKSLTYLEFLRGLTTEELRGRRESNYLRRLKSARFPVVKSLDEFDYVQYSVMWSRTESNPGGGPGEPYRCT